MSSLYELKNDYMELKNMLEDPNISEEAVINTMELVEDEIKDKLINCVRLMKSVEGSVKIAKEERERLKQREQILDNKIKRIRKYMQDMMLEMGEEKIKTDLYNFNITSNPPKLVIKDTSNIPKEYYIEQEPKIDNKALLRDIKNGLEIKGVSISKGKSLRIS